MHEHCRRPASARAELSSGRRATRSKGERLSMSGKMSRRAFVAAAGGAVAAGPGLIRAGAAQALGTLKPRGKRRIVYVSDPSSIAISYLPDPTTENDLRRWVDDLADAGVDTFIQEAYTQGWTTYWRGDRHEYDARPQHRRFLPLLNAG